MPYAKGKYAKAISDRSGMEFPYKEMVKEWNGSIVHKSEYEAKHPQIRRKHHQSDAVALYNPRPRKPLDLTVSLDPNQFVSFDVSSQVQQEDGSVQNIRRQLNTAVGEVTISIS